MNKTIANH